MGVGGTKVLVDTQRLGRHRQASPESSARRSAVAARRQASSLHRRRGDSTRGSVRRVSRLDIRDKPGILRRSNNGHRTFPSVLARTSGFMLQSHIRRRTSVYDGYRSQAPSGRLLQRMDGAFSSGFATTAAQDGAVPLVQMNPTRHQRRCDRRRTIRQLSERLRQGRSRLPSSGHPELRPRDERLLVFLGLHAYIPATSSWPPGGTSSLCSGRWRAQNVTWLWTINTIHKHGRVPSPALVARQLICELGRD